jgi:hypothetical protein
MRDRVRWILRGKLFSTVTGWTSCSYSPGDGPPAPPFPLSPKAAGDGTRRGMGFSAARVPRRTLPPKFGAPEAAQGSFVRGLCIIALGSRGISRQGTGGGAQRPRPPVPRHPHSPHPRKRRAMARDGAWASPPRECRGVACSRISLAPATPAEEAFTDKCALLHECRGAACSPRSTAPASEAKDMRRGNAPCRTSARALPARHDPRRQVQGGKDM